MPDLHRKPPTLQKVCPLIAPLCDPKYSPKGLSLCVIHRFRPRFPPKAKWSVLLSKAETNGQTISNPLPPMRSGLLRNQGSPKGLSLCAIHRFRPRFPPRPNGLSFCQRPKWSVLLSKAPRSRQGPRQMDRPLPTRSFPRGLAFCAIRLHPEPSTNTIDARSAPQATYPSEGLSSYRCPLPRYASEGLSSYRCPLPRYASEGLSSYRCPSEGLSSYRCRMRRWGPQ